MGKGARALKVDPNAARELQTFWDGMIEIDVSAADYVVVDDLSDEVWVRGIEAGDVTGGSAIKIDHFDMLETDDLRTGVTIYVNGNTPKSPMPIITKVYNVGTTAAKIKLFYQRIRA